MQAIRHVAETELATETQQVVRAARSGQTVLVEVHGEAEVAIIDVDDYHLLRAAARYVAERQKSAPQTTAVAVGLTDEVVARLTDPQDRYDLVLDGYLDEAISLSRAAELLGTSWLGLRTRFERLNLPLRIGPTDLEDARAEVRSARAWPPTN
jgi:antitoxin (DNA-binding transcriptional repressor) of toxin-antitoxin stability system